MLIWYGILFSKFQLPTYTTTGFENFMVTCQNQNGIWVMLNYCYIFNQKHLKWKISYLLNECIKWWIHFMTNALARSSGTTRNASQSEKLRKEERQVRILTCAFGPFLQSTHTHTTLSFFLLILWKVPAPHY